MADHMAYTTQIKANVAWGESIYLLLMDIVLMIWVRLVFTCGWEMIFFLKCEGKVCETDVLYLL